jgi:hypothetical protein
MVVVVLFWVEGRGTGTTGVTDMEELSVEEALDEEDEDEAEPPLRLNRPE